jgi:hypothetical protein
LLGVDRCNNDFVPLLAWIITGSPIPGCDQQELPPALLAFAARRRLSVLTESEGADALLQHLAPLLGALYLDFEGLEEGQIAESEQLLGDFHLSTQ